MDKETIDRLLEVINQEIEATSVVNHNEFTYTFSQGELKGKRRIAEIVEAFYHLTK